MSTSIRGRFLWHELMTTDTTSAEAFYTKVVGWKAKPWEHNSSYKMLMAGGCPMAGLLAQPEEGNALPPPPQWFCYIGTPDVDATVRQAVELGGKIMKPAVDLPTVGRFAFLQDPQGAAFTPFTPSGALDAGPRLGDFSWHELVTTNWQAAWDFYQQLFGWTKTGAMDMGGGATYQMFGIGGIVFGGMFAKTDIPGPPFWLPYVLVPDSKRAAKAIKQLDGTITNGPMEIPGGDWIVNGIDPQGAMFAVHSKKPAQQPKRKAKAITAKTTKVATRKTKVARRAAKTTTRTRAAKSGRARLQSRSTKKAPKRKTSRKPAARRRTGRRR
jgi:predicted enzyme related to lactoylglutathione lyase